MSVKTALNNLIPPEWDYVLRKNKVLTVYREYLYDMVPYKLRNKKGYKTSTSIIKHSIRQGVVNSIDSYNTREGVAFWKKIESEINEYIDQCR